MQVGIVKLAFNYSLHWRSQLRIIPKHIIISQKNINRRRPLYFGGKNINVKGVHALSIGATIEKKTDNLGKQQEINSFLTRRIEMIEIIVTFLFMLFIIFDPNDLRLFINSETEVNDFFSSWGRHKIDCFSSQKRLCKVWKLHRF